MCDFSLQAVRSRPAQVADKLTTKNFGTGTTGFCASEDENVAVCLLPGTEIAFEGSATSREWIGMFAGSKKYGTVAIFRQIKKDEPNTHHDMLEFPGGETVLLTGLQEGQHATVLQLPAAPRNEKEVEEQTRAAYV